MVEQKHQTQDVGTAKVLPAQKQFRKQDVLVSVSTRLEEIEKCVKAREFEIASTEIESRKQALQEEIARWRGYTEALIRKNDCASDLNSRSAAEMYAHSIGFTRNGYDTRNEWVEFAVNEIFKAEKSLGVSLKLLGDLIEVSLLKPDDRYRPTLVGWSHTVCHLFQHYEPGGNHSLLDDPSRLGIAKKLIDRFVEFAIKEGDLGNCIGRILLPVINYNLFDRATESGEDGFTFKPESLSSGDFLELLRRKKEEEILSHGWMAKDLSTVLAFCSNQTLSGFAGEMHSSALDEEFKIYYGRLDGLFVDVDGTLVKNGRLDEKVLGRLAEAADAGRKVIIFTGGEPADKTEILQKLGVPERFLPVCSKSEFRGKSLEEVIDDTSPLMQGFVAEKWHDASKAKTNG